MVSSIFHSTIQKRTKPTKHKDNLLQNKITKIKDASHCFCGTQKQTHSPQDALKIIKKKEKLMMLIVIGFHFDSLRKVLFFCPFFFGWGVGKVKKENFTQRRWTFFASTVFLL
jgi:hypothetical protein